MAERAIAYVLKGYPRRSELFIASEIWRLEQLGVRLHLIVLTPPEEVERHAVVDAVRAAPWHLPAMTSLSQINPCAIPRSLGGSMTGAGYSTGSR